MTIDDLSLAGKVAIITGSGKENGIGAGIACALARNGAFITINYISDKTAPRAAVVIEKIRELGGRAIIVRGSVDTPDGAKMIVEETLKASGADHIDILVNNAAAGTYGASLDTPTEDMERIFRTNVFGALYMLKAAVPYMPRGSRVINISSIASKLGIGVLPIYGASKAALDSLSYAWAQELGDSKGITVNTVAPGLVNTDILVPEGSPLYVGLLNATRAEKRIGTVEDVADAVLLLVSEKSRWITGQFISLSGGITGQ